LQPIGFTNNKLMRLYFTSSADRDLANLPTTTMNDDSHPPLRVLLVTDGRTIPHWLFKCVEELERSGAATCVLAWQAAPGREQRSFRPIKQVRHVFFFLYQNLDRYLFRNFPDALAPINLQSALPRCRVFNGADPRFALSGSHLANSPLARALQEGQVDVVLDPFSLMPNGCLDDPPKYGVWTTMFGQPNDPRTQATPAFWEVIEGRPTTEARLCVHWKGLDKKLVTYTAVAATDRRSVSRSQNLIYWKLAGALARKIQLLREDTDAFPPPPGAAVPGEGATTATVLPGNAEMLRSGTCLVGRYLADKWVGTRYREQWALAYQYGRGDRPAMQTFRKLIPPPDRFWADPFPVQVGGDYYIFHEELCFSTNKGSIVLTVVDDRGNTAGPVPILERDYHLSYPFVFQWDGDLFMIPETGSHHQVELYRCVRFPSQWKLERVLLSGLTAWDTTLAFVFGKWWLFASIPPYGAGSGDELHLFYADSPLGPWTPHRNNPIKSDVRSARPAGRIFEHRGQFYRPAQDCSKRYGYGVSINRILQLNSESYEEVEVDKIIPDWEPNVMGVHTLNQAGDMTVIDCLVRRKKLW